MNEQAPKDYISEMIDAIMKVAREDYSVQVKLSEENDDLDSLAMGINMMIDDLRDSRDELLQKHEYGKKRVNEILDVITKMAALNFAKKISVTDKNDVFDATATGLNMLSEELLYSTVSHSYLTSIINSMVDMLIVLSPDAKIVTINPAAGEVLGYSGNELLGHSVGLICPDYQEMFNKLVNQDPKEKDVVNTAEKSVVKKNGEEVPVLVSCSVMWDDEGNVKGVVINMKDITFHIESERAIKDSEARYRALFEGSVDGILIADIDTKKFQYANKAICELLGYNIKEIKGLSVMDIHPQKDFEWIIKDFIDQSKEEKIIKQNVPCLKKDGTVLYADINTTKIKIADKVYNVGFFRDITDRKRVEEEKEKLAKQLQQAQKMEAIGQLAGGIAHDFNNLLGGMLGNSDLLEMKVEQPLLRYVEKIKKAGMKAAGLTNQLLTFARRARIEMEKIDLHDNIEQALTLFRQTGDNHIRITKRFYPEPLFILGDTRQIKNAFLNLATNARDAMPDGGTISCKTEAVNLDSESFTGEDFNLMPGEYAKISFADTGTGMDEKTLKHAFEPFFTTKEVGKGTGLGLASVYGFIKQHKGYIQVESQKGSGSTFTLYLPLFTKEDITSEMGF